MFYESFTAERFFTEITTEAAARALLWRSRFQGKEFQGPTCHTEAFYSIRTRPEVRTCRGCLRQVRLRAETIFEASKTSLFLWVKAVVYVMQGKRGMSAQELHRHWGVKSYGRVWGMLQKIRAALQHRDACYQVGDGVLELEAGTFGRQASGNQCDVLVAIETKAWVAAKGRVRRRAGFAKVLVAKETKPHAQQLVDTGIRAGAMVNTDGSPSLRHVAGVDLDYQVVSGEKDACEGWLPWVHKCISNAKAWVKGTHHGVRVKHLGRYWGEFTYRCNRRHDVSRLFHRAVVACTLAPPVRFCALS